MRMNLSMMKKLANWGPADEPKHKELFMARRHYGLFSEKRAKYEPIPLLEEAEEKAKKDESCFGYYVYERMYRIVDDKHIYDKEVKCLRNVVFGKMLTREQVQEMYSNSKQVILDVILERMTKENADKVFHTRTGRWLSVSELGVNAQIVEC
jgi:hypothetical protein